MSKHPICGDCRTIETYECPMLCMCRGARREYDKLEACAKNVEAENKKLREALKFYADEAHYKKWLAEPMGDIWTTPTVMLDGGEIAMDAMREIKGEGL